MKKLFLGLLSILLCVALCGCGSSSTTNAISNLSTQLDETANTISSVETVSPTSLGSKSENLSATQNALMREEWNKAQILSRTAEIKSALSDETTLSKDEINAMKELTNNLNKYTLSVAYTKNDLDNTLKSISSLSKNEEKNAEKLDAKLNRLACSSNARATYYENILNTLDQIDSYLSSSSENEETDESEQNGENSTYSPYYGYNSNNINRAAYGGYGANGWNYGGYGGYGMNGFAGNGINTYNMPNGYGYGTMGVPQNIGGMTGTPFNLNRNTDTYAPLMRNVDTYRPLDSEKRIEEYEEIGEDETLHEKTTETFAKPEFRVPHEHHFEESNHFEIISENNSQNEQDNGNFSHQENENLRNQEFDGNPPHPRMPSLKPHKNQRHEQTSSQPVENLNEKKPEEIQPIEPQAKMGENMQNQVSNTDSESKIKSVSAETTQEEPEEWDLPAKAH